MSWVIWNEEKWLFIHDLQIYKAPKGGVESPRNRERTTLHVDKHTRCAIMCTFHRGAMSISSIPTIRTSALRRRWRKIKHAAFRDKTVSFVRIPPELLARILEYY